MSASEETIYTLEDKIEIVKREFIHLRDTELDPEWVLEFKTMKCLGRCSYPKRTICISPEWLETNSIAEGLDTLKHETAHAIVDIKYQHKRVKPHGEEWKLEAIRIGAIPKACNNPGKLPKFNYWLECEVHGVVDSWVRKPSSYNFYKAGLMDCRECLIKDHRISKLVLQVKDGYKPPKRKRRKHWRENRQNFWLTCNAHNEIHRWERKPKYHQDLKNGEKIYRCSFCNEQPEYHFKRKK